MEYIAGFHAIETLLKTDPSWIKKIYFVAGRNDQRAKQLTYLAQQCSIPIIAVKRVELDKLVSANQGIVAECQNSPELSEAALAHLINQEPTSLLILDEVQDPHNLGACLRSANAFGVQAVIAPKKHACGLTAVVRKTSCGAASLTPFILVTNLARTLKWLQEQGIWIVGLAGESDVKIEAVDLSGDIAIVMGSEGQGLRKLTRKHCDYLVKIPMAGQIESLNVSVATGVALYEMQRQRLLVT